LRRREPELCQETLVSGGILFRDDLNAAKQIGQARLRYLLLLMKQVALGDQHYGVMLRHGRHRFTNTGQ